ncbi:hypothetical protein PR048_012604 [Dryococelus australis]|uniref:Uncharacterized protein n=1 Tax=Dryococelus australis TaxID=614101 RepID=A0ABQ9HPU7_9NEOP|nr:hypothetical protein PR048_012604 [Dryococelus australis]
MGNIFVSIPMPTQRLILFITSTESYSTKSAHETLTAFPKRKLHLVQSSGQNCPIQILQRISTTQSRLLIGDHALHHDCGLHHELKKNCIQCPKQNCRWGSSRAEPILTVVRIQE